MTNASLQARREAAVPRGVSTLLPVFAARAENAELWDVEGRRFIDFAGGIAVLNTGHRHPAVVAAVEKQLAAFTHTCFQVTPYESYIALAEALNALVPGAAPKKTLLLTTGAEAVENAIKIARFHTRRPAVIAFSGAFHGRTLMGMALTGKVAPYKQGFGPFPSDVYHVPYPNPYRGVSAEDSLKALEMLFKADVEPSRVAAIIIEPVQGEGGFHVAPFPFLREIRALCDAHGILLIADEIQTGIGRTGRMFAVEHAGVIPDLLTLAKSLGGGMPLSAVVGRADVMDAPAPGGLGGTYAGNPLACAAGLAVLETFAAENLLERAQNLGQTLTRRFTAMAREPAFSCIGEVRGLGAMVAMELVKDRDSREPDPDLARALIHKAAENGLILLGCGTYANTIRVLAPLTAADALVAEGLDRLEASLRALTT